MRRAWLLYVLVGAILYAFFFIVATPAELFASSVAHASKGAVTLRGAQGTVWSGSASLVASASETNLGVLRWRASPARLFLGHVATLLDVSGPHMQASGHLRLGFGVVRLDDVRARLSPTIAAVAYSPLSLVRPKGDVEISTNHFSIKRNAIAGEMSIAWRNAAIDMSSVQPLGSYHVQLRGMDRALNISLSTQEGALHLSGQGKWLPFDGGRFEFSGLARALSQQNELEPMLKLLGGRRLGEAPLLIQTVFAPR